MAYNGFLPENVINIGKIYSIHYFEYMSDFSFEGESHDFWEFICVDKGEVEVTGGDKKFILHKGDIAFHEPNEFHNVVANGNIAPNLIVISFQCDDHAMYYFRKKILKLDDVERNILANIIFEARHTFQCRLDDPYLQNMPLKQPNDPPFTGAISDSYCKTLLYFCQSHPIKGHYGRNKINEIQK